MPNLTVTLSAAQFAALAAAQQHHDLMTTPKVNTPDAYLQKVVDGACASYAKQHATDTVPSLTAKVAALTEAKDRAEAEAVDLARQLDEERAKKSESSESAVKA